MNTTIVIDDIRYTPASKILREEGMLGWCMCRLDGRWQIDGIAVRRTREGEYAISFPARIDGNGKEMPYIRPLNSFTRVQVEDVILDYLRKGGWIS